MAGDRHICLILINKAVEKMQMIYQLKTKHLNEKTDGYSRQ